MKIYPAGVSNCCSVSNSTLPHTSTHNTYSYFLTDTSNVVNMNWMFKNARAFDSNINWTVSNVESMTGIFSGAKAFQGNGTENWDISKVNSTSFMFQDAQSFNADISSWNVSKEILLLLFIIVLMKFFLTHFVHLQMTSVTNARYMLMFAQSFNQNLCKWGNTFPYFAADSIFFQSGCTYTSTPQWDTQGPFCGDVCPILRASSASISLSSCLSLVLSSLIILLGLYVL